MCVPDRVRRNVKVRKRRGNPIHTTARLGLRQVECVFESGEREVKGQLRSTMMRARRPPILLHHHDAGDVRKSTPRWSGLVVVLLRLSLVAVAVMVGRGVWTAAELAREERKELERQELELERRSLAAERLRVAEIRAIEPMPGPRMLKATGDSRNQMVIFSDRHRAVFKGDPTDLRFESESNVTQYFQERVDNQGWSEGLAAQLDSVLGYDRAPVTVRRNVGSPDRGPRFGSLIEWMIWNNVVVDRDIADLTDRVIFGYVCDDKDTLKRGHQKRVKRYTPSPSKTSARQSWSIPLHLDMGLCFILLGDDHSPIAAALSQAEDTLRKSAKDAIARHCNDLSHATRTAMQRFKLPGSLANALLSRATLDSQLSQVPLGISNDTLRRIAAGVDRRFQDVILWAEGACAVS